MPFTRPSLSDLTNQVAQDIASMLPGSDPLLRFSNLAIIGKALANLAHLHYGFIDWMARQGVPFTAVDEFLEAWAGAKGVIRKPASSATGSATFTGTPGVIIPAGSSLVRGDGVTFTTNAAATVDGSGNVTVAATAVPDPTGLTGVFGNTVINTPITLGQAISGIAAAGVVSTAFVGGGDLETDASLRSRMLQAYQTPPQGGSVADYLGWALAVPGVTRAWCKPHGAGVGTVVMYVMFDVAEAAYNGFPQGSDGVAASETRATPATGDQLLVANALFPLQPVTALVYVVSPTAHAINFTIQGIAVGNRPAVQAAIAQVFLRDGVPGGTIPIAHIWTAIAAVSGVNDFSITSPSADITNSTGQLPTVGTITYT